MALLRLTLRLLYGLMAAWVNHARSERVDPKQQQQQQHVRLLEQQLEECRWLETPLLAHRREAWEQRQESVGLYDQHATLPALKAERPSLAGVPSPVAAGLAAGHRRSLCSGVARLLLPPPGAQWRGQARLAPRWWPAARGAPPACATARWRQAGSGKQASVQYERRSGDGRLASPLGRYAHDRSPLQRRSTGQW